MDKYFENIVNNNNSSNNKTYIVKDSVVINCRIIFNKYTIGAISVVIFYQLVF